MWWSRTLHSPANARSENRRHEASVRGELESGGLWLFREDHAVHWISMPKWTRLGRVQHMRRCIQSDQCDSGE